MFNKREDRKYVFFGKLDNEDRDCFIYLNKDSIDFECSHYFGNIKTSGACYCRGFDDRGDVDIKTILTIEDVNKLRLIDEEISKLGWDITENSDNYKKGMKLQKEFREILDKLLTDEAEKFFQEIIQEEKEYCMQEYNLDQEEIDSIFESYCYDYQDRAIITAIYEDLEDVAREYIESCYEIDENIKTYIDYEAYGQDLLLGDEYQMLSDGRVIQYSL